MVGAKIEVLCPYKGKNGKRLEKYFPGTIISLDRTTSPPTHHVLYDAGDEETLNLEEETFRILTPFPETPDEVAPGAPAFSVASERRNKTGAKMTAPWMQQLREVWRQRLPDAPLEEIEEIVHVLGTSMADNTILNYDSKTKKFINFCMVRGLSFLPATTSTVIRYLNHLRKTVNRRGQPAIQATSLQPYLSCINRMHDDLGFDPPAVGECIAKFRHGIGYNEAHTEVEAHRTPIPASVLLDIRDKALKLTADPEWKSDYGSIRAVRACIFTLVTFIWFCRADTGFAAQHGDIVLHPTIGITLMARKAKGRGHCKVKKVLTIPAGAISGVEELLRRWDCLRQAQGMDRPEASFWLLPCEAPIGKEAFTDLNLNMALKLVNAVPPPGHLWQGHSLRAGAATAAHSIGVSLPKICHFGDWSIKSSAVYDYIDPSVPSSAAATEFFGWLRGVISS